MIKSCATGLLKVAYSLIPSYVSWCDGALNCFTDTASGPKTAIELRNCQSNVAAYAKTARWLMAQEGFEQLDQVVRDDVVAIAEEMELAIAEIDAIADPDVIWSQLDHAKKGEITERLTVGYLDIDVDKIRARLSGERRAEAGEDRLVIRFPIEVDDDDAESVYMNAAPKC